MYLRVTNLKKIALVVRRKIFFLMYTQSSISVDLDNFFVFICLFIYLFIYLSIYLLFIYLFNFVWNLFVSSFEKSSYWARIGTWAQFWFKAQYPWFSKSDLRIISKFQSLLVYLSIQNWNISETHNTSKKWLNKFKK